ncbi:ankyrin repeat-containing domain protein [Podospora conica]|nr:ankyrin repeat-containing domain protein [Schizothecium conicum]
MEVIDPPPACGLPGGIASDGPLPHPPKTNVIMVGGMGGLVSNDRPSWKDYWLPPDDENYVAFPSPSDILGRGEDPSTGGLELRARNLLDALLKQDHDGFWAFWAEDMGGSVVKLALIIAAEEVEYRPILLATQAVIFFGTPHRGSTTHSMDSALLSLIEAHFGGLLGDWVPTTLNALSRELEDIHKRFIPLCHRFSVISCYQRSPSSALNRRVVVPKECAILGLNSEVTLEVDREHNQMGRFMTRHEEHITWTHLVNAKIAHWDPFRYAMAVLEPHQFGREINATQEFRGNFPLTEAAGCHDHLAEQTREDLLGWALSKDAATTHLVIEVPSLMDPERLARATAQTIWDCPDALWFALPRFEAQYQGGSAPDRVWLLTSLVRQLLTQQPHAFLHMRHLLHNLADAMRHHVHAWKERTLWLCLTALFHAPVAVPMYGFLSLETPQAWELVKQIDLALQGTDSQVRLVLLSPRVNHVEDLSSSRFARLDAQVLIADDDSKGQTLPTEIPDMVLSESRDPLPSVQGLPEHVSLSLLRLFLAELGPSSFTALIWIAFAARPLTTDELDHAVALTEMPDGAVSLEIDTNSFPRGAALRLLNDLPQIAKLAQETVVLRIPYDRTRVILRSHQPKSHGLDDISSPHLYLGDRCLRLIRGVFAAQEQEPEGDSRWTVENMQRVRGGITEYAASGWVGHYSLAATSGSPIDNRSIFSDFIGDQRAVRNWLGFVEYLFLPPPVSECPTSFYMNLSEPRLMDCLSGLAKFEQLKTLYELATRPSTLPALGRLLVYAAENDRADMLSLFTAKVLRGAGEAAIARAIASGGQAVHDTLTKAIGYGLFNTPVMTQTQWAAQMLGNSSASTALRRELLRLDRGEERDIWLSGALRRALEYGDADTAEELLRHQDQDSVGPGDADSVWIILHTAAYYGTLDSVLRAKPTQDMGFTSPDGSSPLFIAASRGLARLVPLVISHGASVDAAHAAKLNWTALHAASRYGRYHTLSALLREKADVTISDQNGDFPLHLGIRWGHIRVAELMTQSFPSVADWDWSHGYAQGDEGRQSHAEGELEREAEDLPLNEEPHLAVDEASSSAPLNLANSQGWTLLIAAAHHNMPTVCRLLLERGADPSLMEDEGKIALHGAARVGSVDMVKDLLDKGSVVQPIARQDLTPLHFACYRGEVGVVEQLLTRTDLNLDAQDIWLRTPLSAASSAGHTSVIKLLLPRYDLEGRAKALCSAVQFGHRETAAYLLDAGCPVNGTDPDTFPLVRAVDGGHPRMERGADLNREDSSGERALTMAAKSRSFETVKILVNGGAEIEVECNGGTPLCNAIYWERLEVVRLLLDRGARLRPTGRWGHYSSVLEFAMVLSSEEVTRLLLEHYYAHGKQEDGLTPSKALLATAQRDRAELVDLILQNWIPAAEPAAAAEAIHYVAGSDNITILEKLIQHPAGKSAVNSEVPDQPWTGTPLHAAISAGRESAVQVLLDAGADPSIVSGVHGTTLNAACVTGNVEMVTKVLGLLSPDQVSLVAGKYGTPFQSAVKGFSGCGAEDTIKVLELLWAQGASPSTVGGQFNTPLHLAAKLAVPVEVVAWLMRHSAYSLSVLDVAGRSPFHMAVIGGNWNVLQAIADGMKSVGLPDLRTTLQSRDNQGLTPLHYAAISKTADMTERLLQLLDEQGLLASCIDDSDVDGWTPLHWACRRGNLHTIVEQLIARNANTLAKTSRGWTPRHIAILNGNGDADYMKDLPDTGEAAKGLPDGAGASVGGYCDICFMTRCWKYWHCGSPDCDDFDLCYKCYEHADQIHPPSHRFQLVTP